MITWRKGLFRVWIIISIIWICCFAVYILRAQAPIFVQKFYITIGLRAPDPYIDFLDYEPSTAMCERKAKNDSQLDIVSCVRSREDELSADRMRRLLTSLSIIFLPPLGLLIGGITFLWVLKGFSLQRR